MKQKAQRHNKQNASRTEARKQLFKGKKGDLNRLKTHKMRSNMGMGK